MSCSGRPCARDHAAAVAGAGVGGGRGEIGAPVAAGGQHDHLGAEDVDRAVVELPRHDADALAVLGHHQVGGEILDVELRVVLQRLAVERVQDRVARAVGGGAGALHRGAFAELGRVAAEGALVDLAFLGAGERDAVMFQLVDRLRRLTREVFHRVGVAQPVGALHRVVHVPVPVVRPHVAEATRRCRPAPPRCGSGSGRPWTRRRSSAPVPPSPASRAGRSRPAPTTTTS
jgi:hypothetical protein